MAAPPPPPPPRRYIAPGDVQGEPLARLLITHPDAAGAVFAHLTYADATHLREACVGFCGAVAEHPWALPLPPPQWLAEAATGGRNMVRTPAGLRRWRDCFPAARTVLLGRSLPRAPQRLGDEHLAAVAGWGVAGVHLAGVPGVTRAGLAALCASRTLAALSLFGTPHLDSGDVAAALASTPLLQQLHLQLVGPVRDGHLAALPASVRSLTLTTLLRSPLWTGHGYAAAAQLRHLRAWLPCDAPPPRGAFARLHHLASLELEGTDGWSDRFAAVPDGLFDGVSPTLQAVTLVAVSLPGGATAAAAAAAAATGGGGPRAPGDGGAALLRPLARVAHVTLRWMEDLTDGGLAVLTGASRLVLDCCRSVVGGPEVCAVLAPRSLRQLSVRWCSRFTGAGLGGLAGLEELTVDSCDAFGSAAIVDAAPHCRALRRVGVQGVRLQGHAEFDDAAAEAALLAAAAGGGHGAGDGVSRWVFVRAFDGWRYTWTATRTPL
jgi:hypothetical protein